MEGVAHDGSAELLAGLIASLADHFATLNRDAGALLSDAVPEALILKGIDGICSIQALPHGGKLAAGRTHRGAGLGGSSTPAPYEEAHRQERSGEAAEETVHSRMTASEWLELRPAPWTVETRYVTGFLPMCG